MVRWVTGGSLAHPPRTQTEADQDRAGAPAARAGKCQLRSLAWGWGGGGGGEGRRGERFDGSEPHPSSRASPGFGPKCVFTLDGSPGWRFLGLFQNIGQVRHCLKTHPGKSSPGSGSGSVFVRNFGSSRPRTHRRPWAMSKERLVAKIETPRPGPG
jgi:hypothetical protein